MSEKIKEVIKKIQPFFEGRIIEYYKGFLIVASSELQLETKQAKIDRNDINGFLTIGEALNFFCNE